MRDSELHCGDAHDAYVDDYDKMTRDWIHDMERQEQVAKEKAQQDILDSYERAMDLVR